MRAMVEFDGSGRKSPEAAQKARLAAALRENLKRRKAQARARKQAPGDRISGPGGPAPGARKTRSGPDA